MQNSNTEITRVLRNNNCKFFQFIYDLIKNQPQYIKLYKFMPNTATFKNKIFFFNIINMRYRIA